jgi:hypothetical protein
MITNVIAIVALTLVTNVTNSTFEMPLESIYAPPIPVPIIDAGRHRITGNAPRRETQRIISTNVLERSTITWVLNGRTNSCTVDRTIYSATQVLRLRETWEPGGLTIHQTDP